MDINSEESTVLRTSCGVPPASVFGPILFNLLSNHLQISEAAGYVIKYAEEITPIISCIFNEPDKKKAALVELTTWCESNILSFNESMTVILCVFLHSAPQVLPTFAIRHCSDLEDL